MDRDWVGNEKSKFITLGASNHTDKVRDVNDFYATDPIAIDKLASQFELPDKILEPACGSGCLVGRLSELGHEVIASDVVNRGCGEVKDFFDIKDMPKDCSCILTNPPYKYALDFIKHSLDILPDNGLCVMFLKTQFLEGQRRYDELFSKNPPMFMFQFIKRVLCAKNADFQRMIDGGGSAVSFAWYVWKKGYKGDTIIKWI